MKKLLLMFLFFLTAISSCLPVTVAAGAQSAEDAAVRLPILMYHSVLPDGARKINFAIHLKELIADLDYIKDNGYTTILVQDLLDYTQKGIALPKKPVMLTFDDGHYNMLSKVLPELEKRGQKAVCAVVGKFSQDLAAVNSYYGYLSFDDIKQLADSGSVEIATHTHNMHREGKRRGAKKFKGESEKQYKEAFCNDIENHLSMLAQYGVKPISMVYPFGLKSYNSDAYLKEMGIKASFMCTQNINYIVKNPDCLYSLCRYKRQDRSAENILKAAEKLR